MGGWQPRTEVRENIFKWHFQHREQCRKWLLLKAASHLYVAHIPHTSFRKLRMAHLGIRDELQQHHVLMNHFLSPLAKNQCHSSRFFKIGHGLVSGEEEVKVIQSSKQFLYRNTHLGPSSHADGIGAFWATIRAKRNPAIYFTRCDSSHLSF